MPRKPIVGSGALYRCSTIKSRSNWLRPKRVVKNHRSNAQGTKRAILLSKFDNLVDGRGLDRRRSGPRDLR